MNWPEIIGDMATLVCIAPFPMKGGREAVIAR